MRNCVDRGRNYGESMVPNLTKKRMRQEDYIEKKVLRSKTDKMIKLPPPPTGKMKNIKLYILRTVRIASKSARSAARAKRSVFSGKSVDHLKSRRNWSWRRCMRKHSAQLQVGFFIATSKESIMANLCKPSRKYMDEKTADKFFS